MLKRYRHSFCATFLSCDFLTMWRFISYSKNNLKCAGLSRLSMKNSKFNTKS